MASLRRYNAEICSVKSGEEVSELWIGSERLVQILLAMQPDDDVVIHRVEDAEPGVIYPLPESTRGLS